MEKFRIIFFLLICVFFLLSSCKTPEEPAEGNLPELNISKEDRILILAPHPDDEILWFSSILDKVDTIVLCYQRNGLSKTISEGRIRILSQYPLKNVISLNVEESNVYKEKHYKFPIETRHGMLTFHPLKYSVYQKNFAILEKKLGAILPDYQTVFTHNPWGEYGQEEHVQVYRVLKKLQMQYGFHLFFDNYLSGKSLSLGKRYLFKYHFPWATRPVNKDLYDKIKMLYVKNKCWTWPENWLCFKDEAFLEDAIKKKDLGKYDHLPPLNIIRH